MSSLPENVEAIFRLTPIQRLMLLRSAGRNAAGLTNRVVYEIAGTLEPDLLVRSWEVLLDRHEALRTAVLWEGLDEPLQVVRGSVPVPLEVLDFLSLDEEERSERFEQLLSSATPLALDRAPLLALTLVRMGAESHRLIWRVHHLVSDRWSHEVLVSEMREIYAALASGTLPDLPPPGRFADHVAVVEEADPSESERYWRNQLADLGGGTRLAPASASSRPEERFERTVELSLDEWSDLEGRARSWRVSPATLILGAVGLVLARRIGRIDPVVAVASSGRSPRVPHVERAVGAFVANVPVRFRLDREQRLGAWLRSVAVARVASGAHEHADPTLLHRWAGLPTGEALSDLLVVLNLDPPVEASAGGDGLVFRAMSATLDGAFPLVLEASRHRAGLALSMVWHGGPPEVGALADDLISQLLALCSAGPDATLDEFVPATASAPARTSTAATSGQPNSTDRAAIVRGVVAEVLGSPPVDDGTDLFELGATSLQVALVAARLETRMQRSLPFSALLEHRSVLALADLLGAVEGGPAPSGVTPRSEPGPSPLSFSQQRLWILDRLDGPSSLYVVAEAFAVQGDLDVPALENAVRNVTARHEILRCRYRLSGGRPVQVVDPPASGPDPLSVERVEEIDSPEVRRRIEDEAWRPFDLESGPLFRARLFLDVEGRGTLVLALHHSVADGASIGVLHSELRAAYDAARRGAEPELAPLPFQYPDFAVWQRESLTEDRVEELSAFWRERLEGLEPMDLPGDRPRPPVQSFGGGIYRAEVPDELVQALRSLARSQGATPFMVLMAAFHALLARLTGRSDIAVGTPVSDRARAAAHSLIGMFVNTLVIRSRPTPGLSFVELLAEIRERTLEAQGAQALPFERIVDILAPPRDLSRHPIFQVFFGYQEVAEHALELPDLNTEHIPLHQSTSKFDLSLYLGGLRSADAPDRLECIWEYASDLFDHGRVQALHRWFVTLLRSALERPEAPLEELQLLEPADRVELLGFGAGTPVDRHWDGGVVRAIARIAAESPERTAVVDASTPMSYGELMGRVHALSTHLRAADEEGGAPVGIHLPRSADLLVAVLGVLHAGRAFVPLDPNLPERRIAFMLQDAGAGLVLTKSEGAEAIGGFSGRRLSPDLGREEAVEANHGPPVDVDPDDLAYVIYTSGSTGRPKGVETTHGNLQHFLRGMVEEPGLGPEECTLAITTLAFDPSMLELLGPLMVGGRVHIVSAEEASTGASLRARLEGSDATLVQATPATWRMLLQAGWRGDPSLRALVGGEALLPDLANELTARCAALWNVYGPTETTVWASIWRVPENARRIRIGRPIPNTRFYVLDGSGGLCPPGVPGELAIGGPGVARGYRSRPDLTRSRFVPDTFSSEPGARMYRTGDRAVFHRDGSLEHLGRLDHQLKVRGFRIEPGEVEVVLQEHPAVKAGAVVGRGDGTDMRLVAYITLRTGEFVTTSEVRRFLRDRVPEYMVPGLVVELDELPTTPNGKVDRRALPDPLSSAREHRGPNREVPVSATERQIARIWSELLGVEEIGRNDNFYELGGHSLLGIRAAEAISRDLKRRVDPRAMFFQSLSQFAARLDAAE